MALIPLHRNWYYTETIEMLSLNKDIFLTRAHVSHMSIYDNAKILTLREIIKIQN